jgi:hypothetical protein
MHVLAKKVSLLYLSEMKTSIKDYLTGKIIVNKIDNSSQENEIQSQKQKNMNKAFIEVKNRSCDLFCNLTTSLFS